jgi:hypothetical protein
MIIELTVLLGNLQLHAAILAVSRLKLRDDARLDQAFPRAAKSHPSQQEIMLAFINDRRYLTSFGSAVCGHHMGGNRARLIPKLEHLLLRNGLLPPVWKCCDHLT